MVEDGSIKGRIEQENVLYQNGKNLGIRIILKKECVLIYDKNLGHCNKAF